MKVVKLEAFPVRVAYKRVESSSLINRDGVTDVIVKLTADNGLVGWGECTRAADTAGIESAVHAMAPLVIGRELPTGEGVLAHADGTAALLASIGASPKPTSASTDSPSRVSEMLPVAGRLSEASRFPQYFTRATLTLERAVTGVPNIGGRPACILFEERTHVPPAPRHGDRPDARRSRPAAPKAAKRLDSR